MPPSIPQGGHPPSHPPYPEQREAEVELNGEASGEELAAFAASDYAAGEVIETQFGRQLILTSPGGLLI